MFVLIASTVSVLTLYQDIQKEAGTSFNVIISKMFSKLIEARIQLFLELLELAEMG